MYFESITPRVWNRFSRAQRQLQKTMIKMADRLRLSLLTVDMMFVIRENEKVAIANILPHIRPVPGQLTDFALLYLDLPSAYLPAGFYKLQIAQDSSQAVLLDSDGNHVQNVRYIALDIFAAITGPKNAPVKKLPIFETFHKSNNSYVIGGTHADGQAFVIVLDF
ncbi:MAG: hypothetical protein U0176_24790 [Bacteroidia bacterium]